MMCEALDCAYFQRLIVMNLIIFEARFDSMCDCSLSLSLQDRLCQVWARSTLIGNDDVGNAKLPDADTTSQRGTSANG